LKNVAATVACFTVSLMLFTGCEKDDPTPEPDNGIAEIGKTYVSTTANAEKVYTLKVSKSLLKSTATATDIYVLLYVDKSGEVKTSTGVVTSSVGESLILTPTGGTPFTVNVTANGITGISGNITFTDNSTATGGNLTPFANGEIEITGESVIVNGQEQIQLKDERVLGVPGMAINYVYNGTGLLAVKEGKTLTVLPGTTIRFTQTGGGIEIKSGATVKMLGEDKLRELDAAGNLSAIPGTKNGHVTLKGGVTKGSWEGVYVKSTNNNEFNYVDFINGGSEESSVNVYAVLDIYDAKIGISHCKISGGLAYGIRFHGTCNITAFDNNLIENCVTPVHTLSIYDVEKFDLTSTFTNNTNKYIEVYIQGTIDRKDVVLNETSVPYYFTNSLGVLDKKFTINEGVQIYLQTDRDFISWTAPSEGALLVKGTVEKPVLFTRLPGATGYWGTIYVRQLVGSSIKNCVFEYGGYDVDGMMYLYNGLSLENVTFRNSYSYGVRIYAGFSGSITHSNVKFENNNGGNVYCNSSIYNTLEGAGL
ncbi:MAG: right-handed parallel beta-helix repeat-containing protein, partial [Dysgonamonadaceae bacterium]|jgi:hypothetical protein|nr:right-handed parallel beta-helix repeat-containing protein [Dysgonamonadaceae bacterium]